MRYWTNLEISKGFIYLPIDMNLMAMLGSMRHGQTMEKGRFEILLGASRRRVSE